MITRIFKIIIVVFIIFLLDSAAVEISTKADFWLLCSSGFGFAAPKLWSLLTRSISITWGDPTDAGSLGGALLSVS